MAHLSSRGPTKFGKFATASTASVVNRRDQTLSTKVVIGWNYLWRLSNVLNPSLRVASNNGQRMRTAEEIRFEEATE